jgi:uncharacterized protein involved in outer membrane biogenesis
MRRKIILGVLTGVILACFFVIIVVVSTYDYNKFKPMITGIAKKYTGRKLTIAGDIKVKISLSPTLEEPGLFSKCSLERLSGNDPCQPN